MGIEVEVDGVVLQVYYSSEGRYFPATREEPEEYPDIDIISVFVSDSGINIKELLSYEQRDFITDEIRLNSY